MIYAVEIIRAYPDYKRPSAEHEVKYFTSLDDATKYLRDAELKICYEHATYKESCKCCDDIECDYREDGKCECGCCCNCHGGEDECTLRFNPADLYGDKYEEYVYSSSFEKCQLLHRRFILSILMPI